MLLNLLYRTLVPLLVCFIAGSSIYMHRSPNNAMMLLAGIGLIGCLLLDRGKKPAVLLQFAALFLFHELSHLNWCFALYILLLAKQLTKMEHTAKSLLLSVAVIFAYSLIRLSYSVWSTYSVLVTFSDVISVLLAAGIIQYIKRTEAEKRTLRIKNTDLLRFDHLTGLQNHLEFRKNLAELLKVGKRIGLVIIDCFNIKKLNARMGYAEVDRTLKLVAEQIVMHFPEALVSRYSGGEFALAFEAEDEGQSIRRIEEILDGAIPSATNVELLYAFAFSGDGDDQQLISTAENRILARKKELLYQEDEHLFRADKLKTIGELAAGMAHEIRNPLTTIKGFLQMAHQNDFKNIEKYYPHMMAEISRVSELTSEFLQFSKPHMSRLKVEEAHACIGRAVSIMQTEAERLGHALIVEESERPFYIRVDRDKIVQVLINLIKNAMEAMAGIGRITIATCSENGHVVMEVRDDGPGIPAAVLDQIFTPFFTTKANGTGLGLPICQKIIHDHGGSLQVFSQASEGTTVRIELPAAQADGGEAGGPDVPAEGRQ